MKNQKTSDMKYEFNGVIYTENNCGDLVDNNDKNIVEEIYDSLYDDRKIEIYNHEAERNHYEPIYNMVDEEEFVSVFCGNDELKAFRLGRSFDCDMAYFELEDGGVHCFDKLSESNNYDSRLVLDYISDRLDDFAEEVFDEEDDEEEDE